MELNINRLDLRTLSPYSKILVIGRRACGATSIMKNLARHFLNNYNYNQTYIFSCDSDWDNFYPIKKCNVVSPTVPTFNNTPYNTLLESIWNKQKIIKKQNNTNNLLLVFDTSITIKNQCFESDILLNSQHYNTTIIIGTQYPQALSPLCRSQFDLVLACKDTNNMRDIRQIYTQYGSVFPDFNLFFETMTQLTKNYMCMAINNRNISNKIEDKVMWFKARKYKQLEVDDWNIMQIVFRENNLWRKLPKDLKNYMINFYYEESF